MNTFNGYNMELKQIKELMTAMERSGTKRLMLKQKEFELVLEREDNARLTHHISSSSNEEMARNLDNQLRTDQALSRGAEMPSGRSAVIKAEETDQSFLYCTSPMVGTFYASPSPDDPTFVKVGDRVEKDTVVCVIEAMKVMNEVKAGVSGVVVEVLIDNAHPVEFGTKLFRIK